MIMTQNQPVYDARQLGRPKMLILGAQHMFAMFGATVLVPALTGLSVSSTLLFAGLGTLLFHFLTKWKVPAFLGSSFAFIGGYQAIAPMLAGEDGSLSANTEMLPYACFGVVLAGLLYVVLSALFKVFGTKKAPCNLYLFQIELPCDLFLFQIEINCGLFLFQIENPYICCAKY